MSVLQKVLKNVYLAIGIIISVFVACRPHGSFMIEFTVCYIAYLLLASPFFYPAFYGTKRDYLRTALFTFISAVAAVILLLTADKINRESGFEGLELFVFQLEVALFLPVVVLITTAFCCRMKKLLKTILPIIVFAIYAVSGSYLVLAVNYSTAGKLFLPFAIIVLLLLLPLTAIMAISILLFSHSQTADPSDERLNKDVNNTSL